MYVVTFIEDGESEALRASDGSTSVLRIRVNEVRAERELMLREASSAYATIVLRVAIQVDESYADALMGAIQAIEQRPICTGHVALHGLGELRRRT